MKIYLTAIIKAKEEFRDEVLKVLQNMVSETVKEEACELYRVHQSTENRNHFIFYEIWKSKEGLDLHNQQPYIKAFGDLVNEKLHQKPEIYLTEII